MVVIYEQLTRDRLMGFSRHPLFGAPNPYKGFFFGAPLATVPSEAGVPGTAAEGIFVVLIGGPAIPEHPTYKKDPKTDVSHRHATVEKGRRTTPWGCI
jgi:hypothetical protein